MSFNAHATAKIHELKQLLAEITPGEWSVPHLSCDDVDCDCGYVLSDDLHIGAIAEVHADDCPPEPEAKANGKFIALSRNYLPEIIEYISDLEKIIEEYDIRPDC